MNKFDFFLPGVEEPGPKYHHGFTSALLELHLDGGEFAMNDLHHALNLLGCDGARPTLFAQKVHHVSCKLITRLKQENKKEQV